MEQTYGKSTSRGEIMAWNWIVFFIVVFLAASTLWYFLSSSSQETPLGGREQLSNDSLNVSDLMQDHLDGAFADLNNVDFGIEGK